MGENENNGTWNVFVREFARAIPWGIVILIVLFISIGFFGQTLRSSVEFAQKNAVITTTGLMANPVIAETVKRNIKEGIEYTLKVTKRETRNLLNDPQLKQDVKEALEFAGKQLKDRKPDIPQKVAD